MSILFFNGFMDTREVIQGSETWLKIRSNKFTFSNGGTLLGKNRFASLQDLYKIFIGQKDFFGNESCRWGSALEDDTIQDYIKQIYPDQQHTVKAVGFYLNPKQYHTMTPLLGEGVDQAKNASFYKCLKEGFGGSPDGLVLDQEGHVQRVIEVKNPHRSFYFKKLEKTPHYISQVITNMYTTDTVECDFIVKTPASFYVLRVQRPDQIILPQFIASSDIEDYYRDILGIIDTQGRFIGYWKVFTHIVSEFYWNATQMKENKRSCPWPQWAQQQQEWIDLINRANDLVVKHGTILREDKHTAFPVPPGVRQSPNWTMMLLWGETLTKQRISNFIVAERGILAKNPSTPILCKTACCISEERFALHFLELFPSKTSMPYACEEGDFTYLEFYTLTEKGNYRKSTFEWDGAHLCRGYHTHIPPRGVLFLTRQHNSTYIDYACVPWTLGMTVIQCKLKQCTLTFENQELHSISWQSST